MLINRPPDYLSNLKEVWIGLTQKQHEKGIDRQEVEKLAAAKALLQKAGEDPEALVWEASPPIHIDRLRIVPSVKKAIKAQLQQSRRAQAIVGSSGCPILGNNPNCGSYSLGSNPDGNQTNGTQSRIGTESIRATTASVGTTNNPSSNLTGTIGRSSPSNPGSFGTTPPSNHLVAEIWQGTRQGRQGG